MKSVWIALGANLDNPQQQLRQAVVALAEHPCICLHRQSAFYRTRPIGYAEQPDFVNAVVQIGTDLPPAELLAWLHTVEQAAGRERSFRNAPRTLDLDIIDYDGQSSADPMLTLPHPRAAERGFVMVPLAEIAPQHRLPQQEKTAAELAAELAGQGVERLE